MKPEWKPHVIACGIDIHRTDGTAAGTIRWDCLQHGRMHPCKHGTSTTEDEWLRYNRKPQIPNTIIHFHDDGIHPAGAQLPRKARATAAMRTMATYHACITHCDDIVRRQVSDRTGHTAPVMDNAGNAVKAGRRSKRGRRVRVACT